MAKPKKEERSNSAEDYYYAIRQDSIVADVSVATIADQFASSNEQYRFFQQEHPKLPIK